MPLPRPESLLGPDASVDLLPLALLNFRRGRWRRRGRLEALAQPQPRVGEDAVQQPLVRGLELAAVDGHEAAEEGAP